jgi:hypothetical protein
MGGLSKGKVSVTIELACDQPGAYSDCPPEAMMPAWFVQGKAPVLYLTIRGAPGCTGLARPVLSGATNDNHEPLLLAMENNYHLQLQELVLDGKVGAVAA